MLRSNKGLHRLNSQIVHAMLAAETPPATTVVHLTLKSAKTCTPSSITWRNVMHTMRKFVSPTVPTDVHPAQNE
jgi:hypothetical protein